MSGGGLGDSGCMFFVDLAYKSLSSSYFLPRRELRKFYFI